MFIFATHCEESSSHAKDAKELSNYTFSSKRRVEWG